MDKGTGDPRVVIIPPASAASWLPDIAPKLLVFLDDRVTVGVTIGPFAELAADAKFKAHDGGNNETWHAMQALGAISWSVSWWKGPFTRWHFMHVKYAVCT